LGGEKFLEPVEPGIPKLLIAQGPSRYIAQRFCGQFERVLSPQASSPNEAGAFEDPNVFANASQ